MRHRRCRIVSADLAGRRETARSGTLCRCRKSAETEASRALSKDLRKRGFSFVGPTTCYAFMQAMGLVNDHLDTCFCRPIVEAERLALKRPARAGAAKVATTFAVRSRDT